MRGVKRNKGVWESTIPIMFSVLLLLAVFSGAVSGISQNYHAGAFGGDKVSAEGQNPDTGSPMLIRLKAAIFDPLTENPRFDRELTYSSDTGYYLVQCTDPLDTPRLLELEGKGAAILGYIPDLTYVVYMEAQNEDALASLSYVRWVGPYQPAFKLQDGLLEKKGDVQLRVIVFNDREDNLETVGHALVTMGGKIESDGTESHIIRVNIDASRIISIAMIPEVQWIDQYLPPQTSMNKIRSFTGANSVHLSGFNGSGIVGEVKDSGIDLDHPDFVGQILATDGTIVDDPHGTPVFGIVFSSGVNNSNAMGMMPGGQGVFCAWDEDPLPSISRLVNNWGGVFQTNSWSTGATDSTYTSASYEHDKGVFDYDITILHSAGNDGIAPYTCTQESVAKNVIAVGAVFHFDTTTRSDDTWANFGPDATPAWGPAEDERVKPDLSGPFDWIYTTDSVPGDGEPGYNPAGDYTDDFGGTSGATPITAGAVGLTYQMFKENHFQNNPLGDLPHASTVKALLIANAYQYDLAKATRTQQGWGGVDIGNVHDVGQDHFIVD
jgi:hypothetical protein